MGEFDCYCAICGGSLLWAEIGSLNPRALERRDRCVSRKRLRMENGGGETESESEEEDEEMGDEDEEDKWWPDQEDQTYDPRLVTEDSTAWLSDARCLGFNPNTDGTSRAFITGKATYDDAGAIDVLQGDDPAQPTEAKYDCYEACEQSRMTAFPFHPPCYEILTRAIFSGDETSTIDREVLYDAMSRLVRPHGTHLDLDYGEITGIDQCWEAKPGEEFSVTNPSNIDDFRHHLVEKVEAGDFQPTVMEPSNPQEDLLARLPPQIIRRVFGYLPAKDLLTLSSEFALARGATHPDFWKRLLSDDMPWLWDLRDVLSDEKLAQLDCRELYMWLEAVTAPKFGIGKPFLAIANRRRIWGVALQLKEPYHQLARGSSSVQLDKDIAERSTCPYMVKVANADLPRDVDLYKSFWVHSWEEIDECSSVVETFWSENATLIGIGITIGKSRRMLGCDTLTKGTTKEAVRLKAGEWISEMHLHLKTRNESLGKREMSMVGVTIVLQNKIRYALGKSSAACVRPLVVSAGQGLVGLIGQINSEGTIVRFGILECTKEQIMGNEPSATDVFEAKKLLWDSSYSAPTRGAMYAESAPIWSHPSLGFLPVFPNPIPQPEEGMLPYQILLWAKGINELSKLERISVFVQSDSGGAKILGLMTAYTKRYWEPKRHIGYKIPEGSEAGEGNGLSIPESGLDIAGPEGEIVTEISVSDGKDLTGIMLTTNEGKSAVFGDSKQGWTKYQALDGRRIVGIAASFLPHDHLEERKMMSLIILHLPIP